MKIRAILYDNSSKLTSNAQIMASAAHNAGFDVASMVFNVHNGPADWVSGSTARRNISAAITSMHSNYPSVKILGYVDSGGSPIYASNSCATTVNNSCDVTVYRAPTLCVPNGDLLTNWCHFARTSSDHDLSTSNCYTNYYGTLRKQVLNSSYSCINVMGYIYDQMDDWMNNLGADGIMIDNVYPGPITSSNWSWNASESHYVFYKSICDYLHTAHSGKFIVLNAAGFLVPEEWVSTTKSASNVTAFFDAIQVYEGPYFGGSCTFPPVYYSGGTGNNELCTYACLTNPPPAGSLSPLPAWLMSGKYSSDFFFASLYCPNASFHPYGGGVGGTVYSFYNSCCTHGIGSAYITTGGSCSGGGSYVAMPSNWSDQVTAIGTVFC